MHLRFHELTDRQRQQARAYFLDAGTVRDRYWYEVGHINDVVCRNADPGDPNVDDEYGEGNPHDPASGWSWT